MTLNSGEGDIIWGGGGEWHCERLNKEGIFMVIFNGMVF